MSHQPSQVVAVAAQPAGAVSTSRQPRQSGSPLQSAVTAAHSSAAKAPQATAETRTRSRRTRAAADPAGATAVPGSGVESAMYAFVSCIRLATGWKSASEEKNITKKKAHELEHIVIVERAEQVIDCSGWNRKNMFSLQDATTKS